MKKIFIILFLSVLLINISNCFASTVFPDGVPACPDFKNETWYKNAIEENKGIFVGASYGNGSYTIYALVSKGSKDTTTFMFENYIPIRSNYLNCSLSSSSRFTTYKYSDTWKPYQDNVANGLHSSGHYNTIDGKGTYLYYGNASFNLYNYDVNTGIQTLVTENVFSPLPELKYTLSYLNDYEVNLKVTWDNRQFSDRLYYSLTTNLNGDLLNKIAFPVDGIKAQVGTSYYFAAYDNSGKFITRGAYLIPKKAPETKEITISVDYNSDYTSCKVNAKIQNGEFSDKLYYSPTIIASGELASPIYFPQDGITVTTNRSYYFALKDSNNKVVARASAIIDKLSVDNKDINVTLETGGSFLNSDYTDHASFIATYSDRYYDLYYYYTSSGTGDMTPMLAYENTAIRDSWNKVDSNQKMYFYYKKPGDSSKCDYTVNFELRNKKTGQVVNTLTRKFSFTSSGGTIDGNNPSDNPLGIPGRWL